MSVNFKKKILKNFTAYLKKNGYDGYLTSAVPEQMYLTGVQFRDGEGILLVTQKGVFCFTKLMLLQQVKETAPFLKVITTGPDPKAALSKIKELKLKKVIFEGNKTSYEFGREFAKVCKNAPGFSDVLRRVKTQEEIDLIKKSCAIASGAVKAAQKFIKTGVSELEVAAVIEKYFKDHGAGDLAFETIVCFGSNTALPHHFPDIKRKLKKEDAVLIDTGCKYQGYCSDITRAWWHGSKPPAEYTKIWNIVSKAQKTALKGARAGMRGNVVDAMARDIITTAGYGDYFTHTLGHSLGIYIHEKPSCSKISEDILGESMLMTIEPGIYLPGKYGVRLEETAVMTKKGFKILTKERR